MTKYWLLQVKQEDSNIVQNKIYDNQLVLLNNNQTSSSLLFEQEVNVGDIILVKIPAVSFFLLEINGAPINEGNNCISRKVFALGSYEINDDKANKLFLSDFVFTGPIENPLFDSLYKNTLEQLADKHEIIADIRSVEDLFKMDLCIPSYQRPYKWEEQQVIQLLNDIKNAMEQKQERYRIGSVILCIDAKSIKEDWNRLTDIVDGQQRITTILLILKALDPSFNTSLETNLKYNASVSYENIQNNKEIIENWIKSKIPDKFAFKECLLKHCEMVFIKVFDISEAFQMFDSQNGTGMPLEPYNLLKAFHLKSIKSDDDDKMKESDIRWEAAGKFFYKQYNRNVDLLKQLFSEQLFKTRLWTRNQIPVSFTRHDIKEFKGNDFEYVKSNLMSYQYDDLLIYLCEKYNALIEKEGYDLSSCKANAITKLDVRNFMQITNSISNGEFFFKYVDTYVELYKDLFLTESEDKETFQWFYQYYCFYPKWYRDGDTYLRELFKSLIIRVYDRFGKKHVNESCHIYELIFAYVYQHRLKQVMVKKSHALKIPLENSVNPFMLIQNAKNLDDLEVLKGCISLTKEEIQGIRNEHKKCEESKGTIKAKANYVERLIEFFEEKQFLKTTN